VSQEPPVASLRVASETGLRHPFLAHWFKDELERIEGKIGSARAAEIPGLLEKVSFDVFVLLLLEPLTDYPNLRAFLPRMPDEEIQRRFTGGVGVPLMTGAARFVERIAAAYSEHTNRLIRDAAILDYGVGWGRLARIFSKIVPTTQIYGVDIWPQVLELNRELGLKGNYRLIDEFPTKLPFDGQFDLIVALSIFTHMSESMHRTALSIWREYLAPGGLVAVTVRPRSFWEAVEHPLAVDLTRQHDEYGYAFTPPPQGRPEFGETSISAEYVRRHWTDWALVGTEISNSDPMQILLYLRPSR
jgi:SAM-dependent methyltransferase